MSRTVKTLAAFALLVICGHVLADTPPIAGVLGMDPVPDHAYAAAWLPVPEGLAVTGIRWYNNDASAIFPRVLLVAGSAYVPVDLEEGAEVASSVAGESSGWSELAFTQPAASATGGVYCLFEFPSGSVFEAPGLGGGAAIGYVTGGTPGWLCADSESWTKVVGGYGLAVAAMYVPAQDAMMQLSRPRPPTTVAPTGVELLPALPNPFNPQTVLRYTLPTTQQVELSVYDVSGRLVRRLASGERAAGTHTITWQGDDASGRRMSSGMYLAKFVAGAVVQTQRLVMVK